MFIYSLRASTVKFLAVLALALVTLVLLIVFVPTYAVDTETSAGTMYSYTKIRSEEDRRAFLSQFGWEVSGDPVEVKEVTIPSEFDKVFAAYNELQKEQGFDLSKYRRKSVMRYTYEVTNYEGYEGTVYVNVIVYRNRVIGGDLCSADASGFVSGLSGR